MKDRYSLYVVVALFALAACQPKSDNIAEKLKKQSEEIQRETDKQIENANKERDKLKALLTSGGQPADIFLSKTLIQDSSSKDLKPVAQLKVVRTVGLGKDGKRVELDDAALVQMDSSIVSAASEPLPAKTYINFGCDNLPESDIEGLKLVKPKLFKQKLDLFAARVFICGKQKATNTYMDVNANELILSNSEIQLKDNTVNVVLRAKTLVIVGKNKIQHVARKSEKASASSKVVISILAEEKLHLQDSSAELEIISEGSSYQAPDKVEAPADPKKDNKAADAEKK